MDGDALLRTYQKWNLVVLAGAIGVAAVVSGWRAAWSTALGGGLGALNFWLTIRMVRRVYVPSPQERSGLLALVAKYVTLFGSIGLALLWLKPQGAAFAAGFCSILVAISAHAFAQAAKGTDEDA